MTEPVGRWILSGIGGPVSGREFVLVENEIRIGRTEENDIPLEEVKASRQHAVVTLMHGRVSVRDLGSKNGTLVNGRKIDAADLKANDEIQIGACRFRLLWEGDTASRSLARRSLRLSELVDRVKGIAPKRIVLYGGGAILLAFLLWSQGEKSPAAKAPINSEPRKEAAHPKSLVPISATDEEVLAWRGRIEVALRRNDIVGAIPLLRQVVAARPENTWARKQLERSEKRLSALIQEYFESGAREYEKLYFDRAVGEWRKVLGMAKGFDPGAYRKAEAKIREAEARLKARN